VLISQISDMHVKGENVLTFGKVDTYGALRNAVAHLNHHDPKPDVVLVTGDLTNDGGTPEFLAVRKALDDLEMPWLPLSGNHDHNEDMREVFADLELFPETGKLFYCVDKFPVQLIGLDTTEPGEHGGHLGSEQLEWLEKTLNVAPDKPTLIFMHHPPFLTGIDQMDGGVVSDAAAFADIVRKHPQIERVTAGHLHRSIQVRFAGTIACTAPGTAHQIALQLNKGAPGRWIDEPSGALMHLWQDGQMISHTSVIGAYGDYHPFNDETVIYDRTADQTELVRGSSLPPR